MRIWENNIKINMIENGVCVGLEAHQHRPLYGTGQKSEVDHLLSNSIQN
jgi:hypothetical protein